MLTRPRIFSILLLVIVTFSISAFGQLKEKKGILAGISGDLSLTGYIDTYIAYDNDKGSSPRQFSAIAPYRDEFRINMAMIVLRYATNKLRSNVALHFGDASRINWPQEPNDYLQFIQEANIGYSPTKNFWIDAGYMLTHIGGEGFIPKYNFFQSLSLCTYYEPFYQSGIKFSYTGKKFYGSFFVLNGYNVFADNNKNKSVGLQLGYKPSDKAEFTYNNIIGNEIPTGTEGKTRIYNNLVVKFWPTKKLDIILCGDFCMQEKSQLSDATASASMFSGFVALKYRIIKKFSASLRGEIFQDKDGIFTGTVSTGSTPSGLKASGVTFGLEFNPVDNAYFRIESRYLMTDSEQKIFYESKNSRVEAILSGGIEF